MFDRPPCCGVIRGIFEPQLTATTTWNMLTWLPDVDLLQHCLSQKRNSRTLLCHDFAHFLNFSFKSEDLKKFSRSTRFNSVPAFPTQKNCLHIAPQLKNPNLVDLVVIHLSNAPVAVENYKKSANGNWKLKGRCQMESYDVTFHERSLKVDFHWFSKCTLTPAESSTWTPPCQGLPTPAAFTLLMSVLIS